MHVQTLVSWWSDYPEDLLTQRVLQPLQRYLITELVVSKKLTVSVMNTIKVLAKIEEANQIGRKLPPEAFYNELIRYINPGAPVTTLTVVYISKALEFILAQLH